MKYYKIKEYYHDDDMDETDTIIRFVSNPQAIKSEADDYDISKISVKGKIKKRVYVITQIDYYQNIEIGETTDNGINNTYFADVRTAKKYFKKRYSKLIRKYKGEGTFHNTDIDKKIIGIDNGNIVNWSEIWLWDIKT